MNGLPPKSLASNGLLVLLLISVSLFSGYLYFKVQAVEKKISSIPAVAEVQVQANNNQPTQAPTQAPTQVPQINNPPPVTDKDHIRGNSKAKVLLVEYSDLECPYCKQFHPTMQQIVKEYGEKVAWVYRHYPLSFHQNAEKEAEATECANELGGNEKFWEYTDKLFIRTTSGGTGFALDKLVPLAKEIGLNDNKFKSCLDSGKYTQHIKDDLNGGSQAGIKGTPETIMLVEGKKPSLISGAQPFDQIKLLVDDALK